MDFLTWASQRSLQPVYAAELSPLRIADGQALNLFWATAGGQWDGQHNFKGCLKGIPQIRHKAQGVFGQSSLISYGDLVVATVKGLMADSAGELSFARLFQEYTFHHRPITIKGGGPGLPYDDWAVVLKGILDAPDRSRAEASFPLHSPGQELLEKQIPPNEYQEDGTIPEATVGKSIPLCLGQCLNIQPVLISESPYIYQFHDPAFGPVQAVDVVRVKGKVVTSGFTIDLDQGTITFTSQPAGTITLDVQGRISGPLGGFVSYPGQLIEDILLTFAGAAAEDFDSTAFSAYNSARPWPVGIFLTSKQDIKKVIDAILTSLLTIFSNTRTGLWNIRRLLNTSGAPDWIIQERDIKRNSYKAKPNSNTPAWKVTIEGRRNWTTISDPDTAVTEADRAWLTESFQQRSAEDSAIQTLYPQALELGPHQTYLIETAHMETLAQEWLELTGQERSDDNFITKFKGVLPSMGDLVEIQPDLLGAAAPQLFRVLGSKEDHSNLQLTPELWG
jgi:hypothetical protein